MAIRRGHLRPNSHGAAPRASRATNSSMPHRRRLRRPKRAGIGSSFERDTMGTPCGDRVGPRLYRHSATRTRPTPAGRKGGVLLSTSCCPSSPGLLRLPAFFRVKRARARWRRASGVLATGASPTPPRRATKRISVPGRHSRAGGSPGSRVSGRALFHNFTA